MDNLKKKINDLKNNMTEYRDLTDVETEHAFNDLVDSYPKIYRGKDYTKKYYIAGLMIANDNIPKGFFKIISCKLTEEELDYDIKNYLKEHNTLFPIFKSRDNTWIPLLNNIKKITKNNQILNDNNEMISIDKSQQDIQQENLNYFMKRDEITVNQETPEYKYSKYFVYIKNYTDHKNFIKTKLNLITNFIELNVEELNRLKYVNNWYEVYKNEYIKIGALYETEENLKKLILDNTTTKYNLLSDDEISQLKLKTIEEFNSLKFEFSKL